MASGRLGAADLSATTNTGIYTVPANTRTTCNIRICNRNDNAATVRLAVVDGAVGDLANADYIEYDTPIGNVPLECSGVVLQATSTIVAYSDTANVSVVVWGMEDAV